MKIRQLTARDGDHYRDLRLTALQTDPRSYLSTFETENKRHVKIFSNELEHAQQPPVFGYYGAFITHGTDTTKDTLVGYVQISHDYFPKKKHLGYVYNLFVNPTHRKQGIASQLLKHAITEIRANTEIERLFLTCSAANKNAYKFYKRYGFKRCGVKPGSIKWNGEYDDEIEMIYLV